jgi:putative flippase GtrA
MRRPLIQKLFRYSAASISGVITSGLLIALLHGALGWPGIASNLTSVTIATIPNYLINRYWTWQRSGRDRMTIEATVFWVFSLLGLLISTVFVAYADHRWGTTISIFVAQLAGFGLLWVGRFVFLDKVLYRVVEAIEEPHEPDKEAAHGTA